MANQAFIVVSGLVFSASSVAQGIEFVLLKRGLTKTEDNKPIKIRCHINSYLAKSFDGSNGQPPLGVGDPVIVTGQMIVNSDRKIEINVDSIAFIGDKIQMGENYSRPLTEVLAEFAQIDVSISTVCLDGRTGKDTEIRFFDNSEARVASTSLAVNPPVKNGQPYWFNLKAWNKLGDILTDNVRKGALISVAGTLEYEHWTKTEDGKTMPFNRPVINVTRLNILQFAKDDQPRQDLVVPVVAGGNDPVGYDDISF